MTAEDRKYFKNKADNDKHRYLAESKKFYEEVARVQQKKPDKAKSSEASKLAKGKAIGAPKT